MTVNVPARSSLLAVIEPPNHPATSRTWRFSLLADGEHRRRHATGGKILDVERNALSLFYIRRHRMKRHANPNPLEE